MKHTPDDNPDKEDIPKATELIKDFLTRVNEESGKSENMFNLAQLDQQLVFRHGENFVSRSLKSSGNYLKPMSSLGSAFT